MLDAFTLKVASEMFFILFQNRVFVHDFNLRISNYSQETKGRVNMPLWVKRAVFYRDRGRCVFCNTDLTGEINISEEREIQYDHIIPLDERGINDVSNIQLTCKTCNCRKSNTSSTSSHYQQWYDFSSS